jgi:UDP-glucose 4-epimerase
MRVLVTGGAGYIGSIVAEALLAEGHAVVVYDHLGRGHRDAVPEGAAFVRGDLLDVDTLRATVRGHRVDAVTHLAGDALVAESVIDPARYYRNNVAAGLSLLGVLRECDVGLLVYSSTCAVYGEPARHPIEESDPTQPANPYGESKLAFERALGWYGQAYGLRWIALRFFNAAGATAGRGERHDPETHLIPLVLQAAAGLRPEVTVFGDDYPTRDGTCVRDYVHVTDLARAHVLALDALAHGRPSAAYNLGCGGAGYTVREVLAVAREVTGRTIPVRVGPRRPGDPAVLVATGERIARELGWRPARQDLREIVASAWAWMQDQRPAAARAPQH